MLRSAVRVTTSLLVVGSIVALSGGVASAAVGSPTTAVYRDGLTLDAVPFVADVEIADVTADGRDDLLATGTTDVGIRLVVWKQKPDGTLVSSPLRLPISENGPLDLTVGDLNGDGASDAAVAGDGSVQVFLQASGALTAGPSYASPRQIASVETADLNDDGRTDILLVETDDAASYAVGRLQKADGSGFMARSTVATLPQFATLAVGDANADGRDDFAIETYTPTSVYLQSSTHDFDATALDLGDDVDEIRFADVTADGRPDAVAALGNGGVVLRPGLAGGGWGAMVSYPIAVNGSTLAVTDVDGNGGNDVVVAGGGVFEILQHQLDHTLLGGCRFSMQPYFRAAAVGDLNSDGAADIATGDPDIHVAYRLAPGEHLDATLTSNAYPNEFTGLQFSGNLTAESRSCVGSAPVQIWGLGPGQTTPTKLAETNFQIATDLFYYAGLRPEHAGTWSFYSRWNGGPYFGIVQSPTYEVVIDPYATALELSAHPGAVDSGESLTLTSNGWTDDGTMPRGLTIRFYGTAVGTRTFLGSAQTDDEGRATLEHAPTYLTTYQAVFEGTSDWAASASPSLKAEVYAHVLGKMTRLHHLEGDYAIYRPSGRIYYRTLVEPNRAGKTVEIYLWYRSGGRWHQAGTAQDFVLGVDGSVTIFLRGDEVDRNRNYRMQSFYGGDRQIYQGNSPYSYFRVE